MRLLERRNVSEYRLTEKLIDYDVPQYAILSHTWGQDKEEVTFEDIVEGSGRSKVGYGKIGFCGEQAGRDGLRYFWVDSCCIKKSSDAELSEAINSMFRWYSRATKCYVYLSDVSLGKHDSKSSQSVWEPAFRGSKWFSRGWTLQELLAPMSVEFFSSEGRLLVDRESLKLQIQQITGIAIEALQGSPLSEFTVAERMEWASKRVTKFKEDEAYSLVGIFGISMAARYGEGRENAFNRLRSKIDKVSKKEHMEPTSKRRKIESYLPDVDHSLPSPAKKDLLSLLRFDQIDNRFVNIRPGHSKTCRWFLESSEYVDWMAADKLPEHHGFFWIKGKPGSGKSTLTKFAFIEIKKTLRNATLLSFFFNARGTHLEKSTIGLYRSLLVQLLETFPDDQTWNIPNLSHRLLDERFKTNREMLKHLLAHLVQKLDQYDIVVIIDALDECDEDEVRDMIALFEKLGENAIANGRVFRVLFSSRHYPHITIQRSVEMKLEHQQGHFQDIEKYLSNEFKAGRGKRIEQIRQEILDRASGIFMWVVLVVEILNKAFDYGHVHAVQKKLQEIPNDLNELFRNILTRDCQNMDEMKLCLQWILHANRPLKREELYFAILSGLKSEEPFPPWDPEEVSTDSMDLFILSSSKGLAEIAKSKDHTVQFIHESVRDFLLKENGLSQVWADLEVNAIGWSHDRLKECCLNYMKSNITGYLDVTEVLPIANSSEAAELRRNASLKYPFLEYAAHNILAHADISHAEGIHQDRFVEEFDLSNWIQLNNIVEKFEIRRLPQDIDLLYIVAERECPNLIDILMRDEPCMRNENGRYGNPIFAAIINGNSQVFEALVKRDSQMHPNGCEFPYSTKGMSSFLAKHGNSTLVLRLLSVYNIDGTSRLKNGETIMSWASMRGYKKIVELLLDRGADITAQGREYAPALQAAVLRGHVNVVELLLDRGADITSKEYATALQAAVLQNHVKVVELLLDRGADITAQCGEYSTALQAAVVQNHVEVVELLLDRGADITAQCGEYSTALQAAVVQNHVKVVELLLDRGADITAQGREYAPALQAAVLRGHVNVVELLLDRGADITAQCGKYPTALQAAAVQNHVEVVELLLDRGADINAQGGKYGNALQAAVIQVQEVIIDQMGPRNGAGANARDTDTQNHKNHALLDYQMQLMLLDQQNKKRLMMTSQGKEFHLVELLLNRGADVNAQGGRYSNALQAASVRGNKQVVELLLDRGADVNAQGGQYSNALQAASVRGNKQVVELLLDRGATINAQCGEYVTGYRPPSEVL